MNQTAELDVWEGLSFGETELEEALCRAIRNALDLPASDLFFACSEQPRQKTFIHLEVRNRAFPAGRLVHYFSGKRFFFCMMMRLFVVVVVVQTFLNVCFRRLLLHDVMLTE